jgi:hypothetical protein
MNAIFDWMQGTWIHHLVLDYAWTFPTLEALHFLGLCLLMGTLLIMDLRLIGFERIIPLSAVHSLMPVAIIGFALNLVTGVGFLFSDPGMYFLNGAFQLKLALIMLAGLNFLLYYVKVEPLLANESSMAAMPSVAKAIGAASLVLWFGVLILGRLLPYLSIGGG